MIKLLLFSLLIVAVAVALLSVKVIFKRGGQFDSQHIHCLLYTSPSPRD